MEFTSILVHLAFFAACLLTLSLLPLGRMLLVLYWSDMKLLLAVAVVINTGLAVAAAHFWGLTTLVVLETLGNGYFLFKVAKGNAALERGLKLLNGPKVEVQVED